MCETYCIRRYDITWVWNVHDELDDKVLADLSGAGHLHRDWDGSHFHAGSGCYENIFCQEESYGTGYFSSRKWHRKCEFPLYSPVSNTTNWYVRR